MHVVHFARVLEREEKLVTSRRKKTVSRHSRKIYSPMEKRGGPFTRSYGISRCRNEGNALKALSDCGDVHFNRTFLHALQRFLDESSISRGNDVEIDTRKRVGNSSKI